MVKGQQLLQLSNIISGLFIIVACFLIYQNSSFIETKLYPELELDTIDIPLHKMCFKNTTMFSASKENHFDCINRTLNKEMILCQFGLNPVIEHERPIILVLGSRGVVGIALTKKLRQLGFYVGEIMSRYHFNLNDPSNTIFRDLPSIFFVFDLIPETENNYRLPHISVPNIKLSNNQTFHDRHSHCYQIPEVWGPFFPQHQKHGPNEWIWKNAISESIDYVPDEKYVFSEDLANSLIDAMLKITRGKHPSKLKLPTMSFTELLSSRQYNATLDFLHCYTKPNNKKPYMSYVTTLSNWSRVVRNANAMLASLDSQFQYISGASFELILVFQGSKEDFDKHYHLPSNIRNFVKLITVDDNSTFYEYPLRNIGIRRARGEYIVACSSDIVFSWTFSDVIIRKLWVPNSLYRSFREKSIDLHAGIPVMPEPIYASQQVIDFTKATSELRMDLMTGASGDFIGMHRNHWYEFRGFLENGLTLHVDSLLLFDFSGYDFPIIVRFTGFHYHLDHVKTSAVLPSVPHTRIGEHDLVCKGYISRYLSEFYRPAEWGAANKTYNAYYLN